MIFNSEKPISAHVELTDICNAMCPMCGRNYIENGELKSVSYFKNNELSYLDFTNIFDKHFFKNFNFKRVNFCGNISDPLSSSYLIDIIKYLKLNQKNIIIDIATNGSIRNEEYFKSLALELKTINHRVTFAIDGLKETHKLYRINTDYKKILKNALSFIKYGGNARWQFLVFNHNKHQINIANKLSKKLGFNEFITIKTPRFKKNNNLIFKFKNKNYSLEEVGDFYNYDVSGKINCKAKKNNEFYVDYKGNIHACCYLGGEYLKSIISKEGDSIMGFYDDVKMNAIKNNTTDIINSLFFNQLEKSFTISPASACKKFCSKINLQKKIEKYD